MTYFDEWLKKQHTEFREIAQKQLIKLRKAKNSKKQLKHLDKMLYFMTASHSTFEDIGTSDYEIASVIGKMFIQESTHKANAILFGRK